MNAPPMSSGAAVRVAAVALVMAAGLMTVAVAYDRARDSAGGDHALFWAGILLIFLPAAANAWRGPSRGEAVATVVLLGLALYLVKVLHSPLYFTFHDEFATLRTTQDIELLGEPFHRNPLIPVHPSFPALHLVTNAVASVTGISTFLAALIVIGVQRVVLVLALFLLFESLASARIAAIATVLYAANPNFVFFDAQWAYESFALPFAGVILVLAARRPWHRGEGRSAARSARAAVLAVLLLFLTVVASHAMTSYLVTVFVLTWAGAAAWMARRGTAEPRHDLWVLGLSGAALIGVWSLVAAQQVGRYLGPVLGNAGASVIDLLAGQSGSKRVFGGAGAPATPIPERALAFAAVAIALLAIPFGLRRLRTHVTPLGAALAGAALLYPATLALRLTQAGTETSNRASEFVYVGVAFLAALAVSEVARPAARGAARRLRDVRAAAAIAAAGVLFLGGVVVGWARYSRMPGPYLVVADPRSVEPEGRAAAFWARDVLGPAQRIVADRAAGLLQGSLGRQNPQGGVINGRSVPAMLIAPRFDPDVRYVLVKDRIDAVVVDRRLSTALPAVGVYVERDEPNAYAHSRPPSEAALLKLDAVCPIGRAFDTGNFVIFDTRTAGDDTACPRPSDRR